MVPVPPPSSKESRKRVGPAPQTILTPAQGAAREKQRSRRQGTKSVEGTPAPKNVPEPSSSAPVGADKDVSMSEYEQPADGSSTGEADAAPAAASDAAAMNPDAPPSTPSATVLSESQRSTSASQHAARRDAPPHQTSLSSAKPPTPEKDHRLVWQRTERVWRSPAPSGPPSTPTVPWADMPPFAPVRAAKGRAALLIIPPGVSRFTMPNRFPTADTDLVCSALVGAHQSVLEYWSKSISDADVLHRAVNDTGFFINPVGEACFLDISPPAGEGLPDLADLCTKFGEHVCRFVGHGAAHAAHYATIRVTNLPAATSFPDFLTALSAHLRPHAEAVEAWAIDAISITGDKTKPGDTRRSSIFSGELRILVTLNGPSGRPEQTPRMSAASMPGWFRWDEAEYQLQYLHRIAHCTVCKSRASSDEHHTREECKKDVCNYCNGSVPGRHYWRDCPAKRADDAAKDAAKAAAKAVAALGAPSSNDPTS